MATQSTPGFVTGQQPSAAQWNGYFGAKLDAANAGTMASQNATDVAVTGGTVGGCDVSTSTALAAGSTQPRSLAAWTGDVVNVLGYTGIDPTGATDSTNAITAALAVLQARNGGKLYLPTGVYLVDGEFSITISNIWIVGDGPGSSIIKVNNATSNTISFTGATSPGIYNCGMRDIGIVHAVTRTAGITISLSRCNQFVFERVNIDAAWQAYDIYITNNITLRETICSNVLGNQGIKWHAPADGSARSDVLVFDNSVVNMNNHGGNGIVVDGMANTLRVAGGGIIGANYGLLVQNTAVSTSYFPAFIYCRDLEIDSTNATACRIEGGSQFQFVGCDFFNLATATGPVLQILSDAGGSDTNSIRITGGRIAGGQQQAIACNGRNVIIVGTNIADGSGTTYNAIDVQATAQDILIADNQIGQFWGGTINKYPYGISVASGATRVAIGLNSYYGCNGEVENLSSGNVFIGPFLDRNGIPGLPPSTTYESNNNTGDFRVALQNTSSGAAVSTSRELTTGTANSYLLSVLHDNAGSPYFQESCGSGVTAVYRDAPAHHLRDLATNDKLVVSETNVSAIVPMQLPSYTVATLPTGLASGTRATVSDNSAAYGSALIGVAPTGGGAHSVPVIVLGGAWVIG